MSSGLASVWESNLMKVCAVYGLKILLGNLTWWMVSSSAPKLQVWKLVLKCVYGKLGFFVCVGVDFADLFWLFTQKHCKRRENFQGKKKGCSW